MKGKKMINPKIRKITWKYKNLTNGKRNLSVVIVYNHIIRYFNGIPAVEFRNFVTLSFKGMGREIFLVKIFCHVN